MDGNGTNAGDSGNHWVITALCDVTENHLQKDVFTASPVQSTPSSSSSYRLIEVVRRN